MIQILSRAQFKRICPGVERSMPETITWVITSTYGDCFKHWGFASHGKALRFHAELKSQTVWDSNKNRITLKYDDPNDER